MTDIMTYRIRIGLYNRRNNSYRCKTNETRSSTQSSINIMFLILVSTLMLLLGNDIETNPGPDSRTSSKTTTTSEASSTSTIFRTSSKRLSLLHINAQSLRYKMDSFTAESVGYDVICVTETWLNPKIDNSTIRMDGFQDPFRRDREDGYGGVAIYVNSSLIATRKIEYETVGLESIWIELKHTHFTCLISCTYRPPNSNREYWEKIEESLEQARSSTHTNIFMLGDYNCDQFEPNNKIAKIFNDNNITQLIKKPTHITATKSTCIDLIATTCPDYIESSGTLTPSLSHHSPVYACLKLQKPKRKCYRREVWLTENVDWNTLNTNLTNLDWTPVYEEPDINQMAITWTNLYKEELKKYPTRLSQ